MSDSKWPALILPESTDVSLRRVEHAIVDLQNDGRPCLLAGFRFQDREAVIGLKVSANSGRVMAVRLPDASARPFVPLKVSLFRIDERSDWWLKALAMAFNVVPPVFRLRDRIWCNAVSIEGDPADLWRGPVRFKLFFGGAEGDDAYAEAFLRVDVRAETLVFSEKWNRYREELISLLGVPRAPVEH